jgi:hypothetical protein
LAVVELAAQPALEVLAEMLHLAELVELVETLCLIC